MYYSIHQRTEMLYSAPIYQSAIGVMSMVTVPIVKESGRTVKVLLGADDLPTTYYNILPDLPIPLPPPIHPGTKEPIGPAAPPGEKGAARPGGARAVLPEGDHPAGGPHEPVRADPGGGPRGVPAARPPAAPVPRGPAGEGPPRPPAGLL